MCFCVKSKTAPECPGWETKSVNGKAEIWVYKIK